MIQGNRGWLDTWFVSVNNWWHREFSVQRRVWISIEGVPLNAWNVDSFRRIGSLWGHVLAVDERTASRKELERGRVLISTDHKKIICDFCILKVGRWLYNIRVAESEFQRINILGSFIPLTSSSVSETSSIKEGYEYDTEGLKDAAENAIDDNIQMVGEDEDDMALISLIEESISDTCPEERSRFEPIIEDNEPCRSPSLSGHGEVERPSGMLLPLMVLPSQRVCPDSPSSNCLRIDEPEMQMEKAQVDLLEDLQMGQNLSSLPLGPFSRDSNKNCKKIKNRKKKSLLDLGIPFQFGNGRNRGRKGGRKRVKGSGSRNRVDDLLPSQSSVSSQAIRIGNRRFTEAKLVTTNREEYVVNADEIIQTAKVLGIQTEGFEDGMINDIVEIELRNKEKLARLR